MTPVVHGKIGAMGEAARDPLVRARARDDSGAQQLAYLNEAASQRPRGPHDQQPFSSLQSGRVFQQPERLREMPQDHTGLGKGQVLRKRSQIAGRYADVLGVATPAGGAELLAAL